MLHFCPACQRTFPEPGFCPFDRTALVVPRRYELRGAVLDESELAALSGKPELLMPSSRPSWKQMPAQTP